MGIGVREAVRARIIAIATALFALSSCASVSRPGLPSAVSLSDYGIDYRLVIRASPRPLRIHVAVADMKGGRLRFSTPLPLPGTPARNGDAGLVDPIDEAYSIGSLLLVNASAFSVLGYAKGKRPLYYSTGMRVDVSGLAMHEGKIFSLHRDGVAALFMNAAGEVSAGYGPAPEGCEEAAAGFAMLVDKGEVVATGGDSLAARTAIGGDATGRLLFVVVEGGRPERSEGASLKELAGIMIDLGARWALNMDGGGSSVMIVREGEREVAVSEPEEVLPCVGAPLIPLPNFVALLPR